MGYSLYYMLTSRCNLNCRYCFRDGSKQSIDSELSIEEIKTAITKLYYDFDIRKITLSGGEPTFLKDNNCENFIELIEFLRQFKSENKKDNLRIILITNAVLMTPRVISHLVGVVDRVTVTIDACDDKILKIIGRNNGLYDSYFERSFSRIKLLSDMGFEIKLHSVVSPINYNSLIDLARYIKKRTDINIVKWKFFQYMGFGNQSIDLEFQINNDKFFSLKEIIENEIAPRSIEIGFKSVAEQESSLFDILPDGKFEYFIEQDGIKVRKKSKKIFEYNSWDDLFTDCPIDKEMFCKLHIYG